MQPPLLVRKFAVCRFVPLPTFLSERTQIWSKFRPNFGGTYFDNDHLAFNETLSLDFFTRDRNNVTVAGTTEFLRDHNTLLYTPAVYTADTWSITYSLLP